MKPLDEIELSIIIPTYNERKNIEILIPDIEKKILTKMKGEIIVVDDNSPDATAFVATRFNRKYKNIKVIMREKKQGIGSALREGYNFASGKLILSTDADLSFSTKDMIRLIDKINTGYDLVVGNRHSNNNYEIKGLKTSVKGTISKYGNKLIRFFTRLNIHDYSANFRVIKKSVWKDISTKENTNSILFEMIIKTNYKGYKVAEIPVKFKDRRFGKSKINLFTEVPKFFIKLIYYSVKYRVRT